MSYLYTMLENEEFVEMPEVEEDSIAEDTSEEVQALEGISAAAEVTSDQIDAAEEVAVDIEESVTEEGRGMDAVTAYHIGKRMEAIMAISREKPRRSITVENFDHAGGRHSYTMQALADVKDTIKRWWKKLKDLVMKYVDKVVDLWNKYASDVARLKMKAKSLANKASNATGSKGDSVKLSAATVKSMCITSKDDYKSIQSNLSDASKSLGGSSLSAKNKIKNVGKAYTDIANAIDTMNDATGDDTTEVDKATAGYLETLSKAFSGIAGSKDKVDLAAIIGKHGGNDKVEIYHGGITNGFTFGGVKFGVVLSPMASGFSTNGTKGINDNLAKALKDEEVDAPALDRTAINTLCTTVMTTCDALIENTKATREMNREVKEVIKLGERVVEKLDKVATRMLSGDTPKTNVSKKMEIHSNSIRGALKATKELPAMHNGFATSILKAANNAYGYAARSFSGLQKD